MERFIEDLRKNRCSVLSIRFDSPDAVTLRVRPPRSSVNVKGEQTLPNHPLFMLKLRLETEAGYEEIEPDTYEVRISHPRKPFSEEQIRQLAQKMQLQYIVSKNGNSNGKAGVGATRVGGRAP